MWFDPTDYALPSSALQQPPGQLVVMNLHIWQMNACPGQSRLKTPRSDAAPDPKNEKPNSIWGPASPQKALEWPHIGPARVRSKRTFRL